MPAIVSGIEQGSIAEELDIKAGDIIISIDNISAEDLIDYKYLVSSEEISLYIKRSSGEEEIIDIEKDMEEDLGIVFESAVFNKVIPCNNKCIFCFVDQQPENLRESLYVKDDDYRLSYLQGTYITLTNLTKVHKERIERLRPGPLYISVHSTNPDLRSKMLNNNRAKNILKDIKWLSDLQIPLHIQLVLCPGINDGDELNRTLNDLALFKHNILSIAVVPVGLTKFRKDNNLVKVTSSKAKEIISQIEKFNKKIGYNLAFPSDEFYILAKYDFPSGCVYGNYGQLEDGVGSCRLLLDDFEKNKHKLPKALKKPKSITMASGTLAYTTLNSIVNDLNKISNLKVDLIPIKSNFWGKDITVSGLITGKDLLDNLTPVKSKIENLVLPSVMLKKYSNVFIDGIKVEDIETSLDSRIFIINDYYKTDELINLIKE